MASNNPIHRLNLVDSSPSPNSLADTQDILSIPPYSDLAAQLDLWTHVSFASDEPFAQNKQAEGEDSVDKQNASSELDKDEIKRKRQLLGGPKLTHELPAQSTQPTPLVSTVPPPFDLQSFLALAGMAAAPMPLDTMNLNNLLALAPYQSQFPAMVPGLPVASAAPTTAPAAPAASATSQPSSSSEPPAKRARTRKSSVGNSTAGNALSATSTSTPPQALAPAAPAASSSSSAAPPADAENDDEENSLTQPEMLNAAEDKRRRNTQASARFRLKKKEREAAMEQKCKDLEAKVSELERECEALRRENGWLKGLVVGVTGGTGGMPMSLSGPPSLSRTGASAPASGGEKRKRDAVDRQ